MDGDPYLLSKMVHHFVKLQQLQDGKPISPTNIQVDLELYCNDNCSFCSYRAEESHNAKNMMPLLNPNKLPMIDEFKPIGSPSKNSSLPIEFAKELPKQFYEAGIPSITFTGGGESTLWSAYDEMIDNCIKYELEIGLITNGSTMTDKRIDIMAKHFRWVRISIDASNPETHKQIHRTGNSDFERRLEGIKKLVAKRKEYDRIPNPEDEGLTIGVNFVITEKNYEDILNTSRLFSEIGIDYIRFSFMYIEGIGIGQITKEQLSEAESMLKTAVKLDSRPDYIVTPALYKLESYTHPNDDFNTCYMQRFVWALGADCKIYPCCIQKYIPGFEIGDIRENTLNELITKSHGKMTNLDVKSCPSCWMRDRNKAVENIMKIPKHVNFV